MVNLNTERENDTDMIQMKIHKNKWKRDKNTISEDNFSNT